MTNHNWLICHYFLEVICFIDFFTSFHPIIIVTVRFPDTYLQICFWVFIHIYTQIVMQTCRLMHTHTQGLCHVVEHQVTVLCSAAAPQLFVSFVLITGWISWFMMNQLSHCLTFSAFLRFPFIFCFFSVRTMVFHCDGINVS